MISTFDNLGAVPIRGRPPTSTPVQIPFLMEVVHGALPPTARRTHRTPPRADGQLILRETAQIPPGDEDSFRDYRHWRYYNTNNLWVDLRVLADTLERARGVLELPLIVNRKTVDPRDPDSTPVIQLESAMGAAIESFPGASLLLVPRRRFVPVKTTDDLLVLRSDVYRLSPTISDVGSRCLDRADDLPFVELDKRFYKLIDQFERRFPAGASVAARRPSRLIVHGDVTFGAGVVVRGSVELDDTQAAETRSSRAHVLERSMTVETTD